MLKHKPTLLFVLLLLITAACSNAAPSAGNQPRTNSGALVFRASSEFETLKSGMISACEKEIGVTVEMHNYGDIDVKNKLDAEAAVFGDPIQADIYAAASPYWVNNPIIGGKTTLAMSPVVLVVSPEFEQAMGWGTQSGVDIYQVLQAATINPPMLNLGLPSASQDDAGMSFVAAAMEALKGDGTALQAYDVDPLSDMMKSWFGRVTVTGSSAARVKNVILQGNSDVNAAVLPENLALAMNQELINSKRAAWKIYYVRGATSMQMYTIGYVDEISSAKKDLAKKFIACLAKGDWIGNGFRKANVSFNMPQWQDKGLFRSEWGVDVISEPIISVMPQAPAITALQQKYQGELKLGGATVILNDLSPSMFDDRGAGIQQLNAAMRLLLLQDVANQSMLQASPKDIVWLVLYDGGIKKEYDPLVGQDAAAYEKAYADLLKQRQGSSTDFYGAIVRAYEILASNGCDAQQCSIILLTDGEQVDSDHNLDSVREAINIYNLTIPVYSIRVGKALPEELKDIADLTGGEVCDGTGGEEALIRCFKQFKGNN